MPESTAPWIIVMAGGSGKRFWPLSRQERPKQALSLFSAQSLLQDTVDRIRPLTTPGRILVNTSRELRPRLEKICAGAGWLEEPCGRDTAPCVGFSAAWVHKRDPDSIMVLLPADHYVPDAEAFRKTLKSALLQAEAGEIVTIGIKPTRPETGYGYIEMGEATGPDSYRVRAFVEKPDLERAMGYLASGRHLWNGGIFIARAQVLLEAFQTHQPPMAEAFRRMAESGFKAQVVEAEYRRLNPISFDHAIMEKVSKVRVLPAVFPWDDVGSWLSLERVFRPDKGGNIIRGRHVGRATEQCVIVSSEDSLLVATAGIRDLVVIQTPTAVLVAHKKSLHHLKPLLEEIDHSDLRRWL